MKGILSIQDLSCVGRCSLTVALPVLSAMNIRCSVLPTAVLSTHTGFPNPYVRPLTDTLSPIAAHWHSQNISFDAICVGYLSDPEQAETILDIVTELSGTVILDPVLGDGGKAYARITEDHVSAMKRLCQRADVLLPNLTEAALLTGIPYEKACRDPESLLASLASLGPKTVVITGTETEDTIGFVGTDGTVFRYQAPRIPKKLHGTGDLFAAVFAGAYVSGKSCRDSATLAARFVERVVQHTDPVTPFGPEFETQLPWLWEQR